MKVKAEFQEITIVETIPGHPKVLANSIFTGALPGFYTKSTFAENLPNFSLEGGDLIWGTSSDASVVNVGVLQDSLQDCGLEVWGSIL